MMGVYDLRLVALSYLVAVFASYTALDLAGRIVVSSWRARLIWLLGGAVALGIGIWSMHFTGMLAFLLPMPVQYDLPLVILSLLVAIIASAAMLFVMARPVVGIRHLLLGSPIIGVGIASMHYIGMAAMHVDAKIEYRLDLVALSVAIAIGASAAALWLAFRVRGESATGKGFHWSKLLSAMVMGLAICGMHYVGMAAAHFNSAHAHSAVFQDITSFPLALAIVAATLIILGFTLLSTLIDRRFAAQERALAASTQRYQSLFQHHSDAVLTYDRDGNLYDANQAALALLSSDINSLRFNGLDPFLSPADQIKVHEQLIAAVQGTTHAYDLSIMKDSHTQLQLNVRNVPIMIKDQIVGVYLIATDITERTEALAALEQNEDQLRSLLAQQQGLLNTIRQLSTPILPVSEQVLLVPLVGDLDSERCELWLAELLHQIETKNTKTVLLDITGVAMITTEVASYLVRATQAARLLGTEMVLVGVTPEVAQTIVYMGMDLNQVKTRNNLQSGIIYALNQRLAPF